MTTSSEVKRRRERLGITQEEMAAKVRELSRNPKYSQQSYQKFEGNPSGKSAYLIYIIQALDEAERSRSQDDLVRDATTLGGVDPDQNDMAAAVLRRIAQLLYSSKLTPSDIALLGQIVERMASEKQQERNGLG